MKTKQPKPAIRQNRWDNWYGYLGGRKVAEFGLDRQMAEAWLAVQIAGVVETPPEEPRLKLRRVSK